MVKAVAQGGIIAFNCGPKPVTITMTATAKVVNTSHRVVLDGGGKVTLSGGGKIRILYMNTCDPKQKFTTNDCWEQQWPQLVVQNLTFKNAYSPTRQTADVELRRRRDLRPGRPAQGRQLRRSSTTGATRPVPTSAARRSAPSACT